MTIRAQADLPFVSCTISDVVLTGQGHLTGQIQCPGDLTVAGSVVSLSQGGRQISQVRAGADGRFVFADVKGGMYELNSAEWRGCVRVWTVPAAPPAAEESMFIVRGQSVPQVNEVRRWDEFALNRRKQFRSNPQSVVELATWTNPAGGIPESHLTGSPSPPPETGKNLLPIPELVSESPPPMINDGAYATWGNFGDECLPDPAYYDMGGPPPPACCPPTHYGMGPTIGQVLTATAVITGVALGAVGIYDAVKSDDRVRRPVSP